VRRCAEAGVVVGRNASTVPGLGNVLILAPPFVIEEHECARVAETLRAALDA
jgi:adenosylmethionine-8-amino-7-oxononanoate aminotransferase